MKDLGWTDSQVEVRKIQEKDQEKESLKGNRNK